MRFPDLTDLMIVRLRVSGRVSIDGHRPDEALENAERAFRGAPTHDTLRKGVSNLASFVGPRRVFGFVGHGQPGFISCGCGCDGIKTPDNYVALNNEGLWQPEFAGLQGRSEEFVLVACHTAKGRAGLDLLQRVACATQMTAVAPTRALATRRNGAIWLTKGCEWQYVRCDGSNWRRSAGMIRRLKDHLFGNLAETGGGVTKAIAGLGEVKEARYTPLSAEAGPPRVFPGEEALDLLASVERTPDRLPSGTTLLSLPTGHLEVVGGDARRRFTVYGGSLLRDDEDPGLVYETDDGFLEKLGGWDEVIGRSLPTDRPTQTA